MPLSIYMDIGSAESSSSQDSPDTYWFGAFGVYNTWFGKGYSVNSDLLFYPQCGAQHNETAWSGRLPVFYFFVLNLWSEPNSIALAKFPPRLDLVSVDLVNGKRATPFSRAAGHFPVAQSVQRSGKLARPKRARAGYGNLGGPDFGGAIFSFAESSILAVTGDSALAHLGGGCFPGAADFIGIPLLAQFRPRASTFPSANDRTSRQCAAVSRLDATAVRIAIVRATR